jgi:hypothetical protein
MWAWRTRTSGPGETNIEDRDGSDFSTQPEAQASLCTISPATRSGGERRRKRAVWGGANRDLPSVYYRIEQEKQRSSRRHDLFGASAGDIPPDQQIATLQDVTPALSVC